MRPKNLEVEKAIRSIALRIIAEEGLENLTMQKLAKEVNISPRTIYLKYENKEDLLIKLFIDEVLGAYEKAVLTGFDEEMSFSEGMQKLWTNTFQYLKNNRHAFMLLQHGKTSPLLNKAYQKANIKQGQFFSPVHRFLMQNIDRGIIKKFPLDVSRALLFSPVFDLVNEYFDYQEREHQIITEAVLTDCCSVVIKGILNK